MLVCDWARSTVQILCQIHYNSIPFQWEYIQSNNAALIASYITNYILKLSLEYFKDLDMVKSFTDIK